MTFEEKVKYLKKTPRFMVEPEVEIKAVAYSARLVERQEKDDFVLGQTENGILVIKPEDIEKILREYPDLESKFIS